MDKIIGKIYRVVGPVVEAQEVKDAVMFEMVEVGKDRLVGEIVRLAEDKAFIQVYEDTTSLRAGDNIYSSGLPLFVELGPGLISSIYDGIQRPLEVIREESGYFIQRGVHVFPLARDIRWHFTPLVKEGDRTYGGHIIGQVKETPLITHKIMIPSRVAAGKIKHILPEGDYTLKDTIAIVEKENGEEEKISLFQRWPVRKPRPYKERKVLTNPLITGQRVIDTLFPVAKGGTVGVPGGFGTGKTIIQHQLAKWCDADIIVFVGCGERGNEMTDVLLNFPKLIDPKSGRPLIERTIFIANTSNMPVAAREASIYTGITLAEYYRDMGYNVALMADSTSRWAEALRELSARLEEMPADEGFPAYLPSRLAEFYERAGVVDTLGGEKGSVTVIGSVSPPGGDFSEPVTSHTKRFIRCFWALDKDLANARHYPSINWLDSYSEYLEDIKKWWQDNIDKEWYKLRLEIVELLQKEAKLQQVVKLVGPDVLPDTQRVILEICSIFKNTFLQQNAFDEIDSYTVPKKQALMLKIIVTFYQKTLALIKEGIPLVEIKDLDLYTEIVRMKFKYTNDDIDKLESLLESIDSELAELRI